jgi:hypothetical protein
VLLSAELSVFVATVTCGLVFSYRALASPAALPARRQKSNFLANLFFALAFCLATPAIVFNQHQLPIIQIQGVVQSTSVASPRIDNRLNIVFQPETGALVILHTSGGSSHFRPGQRAEVQYEETTGNILYAQFLAPDGHPKGVFRNSGSFLPSYFPLVTGLFILYLGWRRYKRDRAQQLESPETPNPA